jgi:hypothetical protein
VQELISTVVLNEQQETMLTRALQARMEMEQARMIAPVESILAPISSDGCAIVYLYLMFII